MTSQKTVGVLFGGVSSEYDVSLMSATSIINHLSPQKYDLVLIGITRDGRWLRYTGNVSHIIDDSWLTVGPVCPAIIAPDRSIGGIVILENGTYSTLKLDVVFPVLHGKNGEDGTVQGLLQLAGIPFVGCDVPASAMCMDKTITHTILESCGIPTAKWQQVAVAEMQDYPAVEARLLAALPLPLFVKPANAGSSVGVSKVCTKDNLKQALETAFQEDTKAVVEEAIVGQEVETSVLGGKEPIAAAMVGELAPTAVFYDYNAKYISGDTAQFIPARLDSEVVERLRSTAVQAYKALGCHGLARVDFFVRKDGSIVLNEPNTMPGFTSISMYPKLWEASGTAYPALLEQLIALALERGGNL